MIHLFADVSHDAVALEEIARPAAHRQIGITVREHAGVLAAGCSWRCGSLEWCRLPCLPLFTWISS